MDCLTLLREFVKVAVILALCQTKLSWSLTYIWRSLIGLKSSLRFKDSVPWARFVFGNVCRKEKKMKRNMSKWSKGISHNGEIWSWMKFKTGLTSIAFGDLSNFLFLRSRAEMDIESQAWLYKLCKGKVSKIISSWKGKAGKGKKIPIFFFSSKASHHRCCWLDKYLLFK